MNETLSLNTKAILLLTAPLIFGRGRGFLLSQAVERWQSRAIWVVSRSDDGYPQRLKARLKKASPNLLYGCGDHS